MNYIVEFIKIIFPNPIVAIFYIVILILAFWMYKEIRNSYLENTKYGHQRTDKAIEIYSELEFEIYKYMNDKGDFITVIEKMSKTSFLLPYDLFEQFTECKNESDSEKRKEHMKVFHSNLYDEIIRLKSTQNDPITFKNDDGVKFIENYIRTKIAPFYYPLLHTILNIFFLLVGVIFIIELLNAPSITHKIMLISTLVAAFIYFTLIYFILCLVIIKGRFKHTWTNWILFLFFAISPMLFLFNSWYSSITITIISVLYCLYHLRKSVRKSI